MMGLRKYGREPFRIAVLHGGPGAAGELAPVARELSTDAGVLEPVQTQISIPGQVEELKADLEKYAALPVILAGFSWGAWLGWLLAAQYPALVGKLILISSGPFEEKYAAEIMPRRLERLTASQRTEALSLSEALISGPVDVSKLARFGELMVLADSYDPLPDSGDTAEIDPEIHRQVWQEACLLRSSGALLRAGEKIRCPVVAIHGDYDSHPAAGVEEPLSRVIKDFRFILLEKCGHYPWRERRARDNFYRVLRSEIKLKRGVS